MRSGALYCPIRDMTVAMVQTNDMWLQWTLLSAEMSALGPDRTEKSVTFFARRARTYRSMNESISNPKTRFSDHTITGLTMAGLIETRLGNTASGRIHMAAVRALVRSRAVVHGVPMQVNFATFCNTTRIGLDSSAFPDVAGFESALSDFLDAMAGMQRWTLTSSRLLDTKADDADSETSPSVRRYALARRRAFSPSALLHRFIGPTCYEEVGFERRSHVARLWGINRILYELRDDLDQCTDFLETLHRYMESTNELSPTDRRASAMDPKLTKLKVTAVNAILGKVGTIFLAKRSAGDSFWWRTVDAVEILHLLSLSTRARLLAEFSAGLIGSETPEVIRLVTENQLKNIADEIRQAWIAQQALDTLVSRSFPGDTRSPIPNSFREVPHTRPVTFINHDAEHLEISPHHIRSINSHINSHKVQRTRMERETQ